MPDNLRDPLATALDASLHRCARCMRDVQVDATLAALAYLLRLAGEIDDHPRGDEVRPVERAHAVALRAPHAALRAPQAADAAPPADEPPRRDEQVLSRPWDIR